MPSLPKNKLAFEPKSLIKSKPFFNFREGGCDFMSSRKKFYKTLKCDELSFIKQKAGSNGMKKAKEEIIETMQEKNC